MSLGVEHEAALHEACFCGPSFVATDTTDTEAVADSSAESDLSSELTTDRKDAVVLSVA